MRRHPWSKVIGQATDCQYLAFGCLVTVDY